MTVEIRFMRDCQNRGMESERPIAIIFTLIWFALASGVSVLIWYYFRTRRATLTFWQFTIKQYLVLIAIWALLISMLYLWVVDHFFT
jgi:hypothetical protein